MEIRLAHSEDIPRLNELLYQVHALHAEAREDIFIKGRKKYTSEELEKIIKNKNTPVFVYEDDGGVEGYAFCIYKTTEEDNSMHYRKTLYIDDLCVDEKMRRKHIGYSLFEYVKKTAKENECQSVTLNVWNFNENAMHFYIKCGLKPLKTIMEEII